MRRSACEADDGLAMVSLGTDEFVSSMDEGGGGGPERRGVPVTCLCMRVYMYKCSVVYGIDDMVIMGWRMDA